MSKTFDQFIIESAPSESAAQQILLKDSKFKALIAKHLQAYKKKRELEGQTYNIHVAINVRTQQLMVDYRRDYIAYIQDNYSHTEALKMVNQRAQDEVEDVEKELKKLQQKK